ncbi:hypothetical protein V8C86DRAFT_2520475 [Haematococcus lacustris]
MYAIGKLAASRLSTVLLAGPPLGHGLLPVAAVAFRSWSSSAGPDSDVTRNAEKLLEVLAHSPAMQQVMLANLPPALRGDPAMVKAILSDPGVKQKLVEMISKQGVKLPSQVLEQLTPGHMDHMMERLQRAGIHPPDIPAKLMAHPTLFKQLQEPQVMQAFLETAEDPGAATKYSPTVMAVVREAQAVLRGGSAAAGMGPPAAKDATVIPREGGSLESGPSPQQPIQLGTGDPGAPPPLAGLPTTAPPPSPPSPSAPSLASSPIASSSSGGSSEASQPAGALGEGAPFLHLLRKDPGLRPLLEQPRVLAALQEISKSPWKTVKYIFDKDVMKVFSALNTMLKNAGKTK